MRARPAAGSLRSLAPAVPARLRRAKLNARVERLPDAQQEIQLEARLLRPERRVCLDLDHVAVHPLDPTLASSEEVDQFVRQRGVAELNPQAPQPPFLKSPPLATSSFLVSAIRERRQLVERGISVAR